MKAHESATLRRLDAPPRRRAVAAAGLAVGLIVLATATAARAGPVPPGPRGLLVPPAGPLTTAQQHCVGMMNKHLRGLAKTVFAAALKCMKQHDRRRVPSVAACLAADRDGKIARAGQRARADNQRKCAGTDRRGVVKDPLALGSDPGGLTHVATLLTEGALAAVFGTDVDGALVDATTDRRGARCQAQVATKVTRCHDALVAEFVRCKKDALRSGKMPFVDGATTIEDIATCLARDPKGKIAEKCDRTGVGRSKADAIRQALGRKCVDADVELAVAFPQCAAADAEAVHACLVPAVRCLACRAIDAADGLGADCDLVDDGAANASCVASVLSPTATTAVIGPGGGEIVSPDGRLTLAVPAGALPGDTTIRVRRLAVDEIPKALRDRGVDLLYDLDPDGLTFAVPITVTLDLEKSAILPDGTVGADMGVLFSLSADGKRLEPLGKPRIDLDALNDRVLVAGELTHFSDVTTSEALITFKEGVLARITILDPPPNDRIFLGSSFPVEMLYQLVRGQLFEPSPVFHTDETTSVVVYTGEKRLRIGEVGNRGDAVRTTLLDYACGNTPGLGAYQAEVTVEHPGLAGFLLDALDLIPKIEVTSLIGDFTIFITVPIRCEPFQACGNDPRNPGMCFGACPDLVRRICGRPRPDDPCVCTAPCEQLALELCRVGTCPPGLLCTTDEIGFCGCVPPPGTPTAGVASPTPTITPAATASVPPSVTPPVPTVTVSPTPPPPPTPSPTVSPTATRTPTVTPTSSPTPPLAPSATPTAVPTSTPAPCDFDVVDSQCGGACPDEMVCQFDGADCGCVPADSLCDLDLALGQCGGFCPRIDHFCLHVGDGACGCVIADALCDRVTGDFQTCQNFGFCQIGEECVGDDGECFCVPAPTPTPSGTPTPTPTPTPVDFGCTDLNVVPDATNPTHGHVFDGGMCTASLATLTFQIVSGSTYTSFDIPMPQADFDSTDQPFDTVRGTNPTPETNLKDKIEGAKFTTADPNPHSVRVTATNAAGDTFQEVVEVPEP